MKTQNIEMKRAGIGLIHQPAVSNVAVIYPGNRIKLPPGQYKGSIVGWTTTTNNGWNKVEIFFQLCDPDLDGEILSCFRNIHPLHEKPGPGGAFSYRKTQDLAMDLALLFPEISDFKRLTLDLLWGLTVELKVSTVLKNYAKKNRPECIQYSKVSEIIRIVEESNNKF